MKNKHGLSRRVPDRIKREVRQRCRFGCILCGKAIIQYDHFDPPFEAAKEHVGDGITLLCGGCHDEKNHGFISDFQIATANLNPYCKSRGDAFNKLRLDGPPTVILGTTEIWGCPVVLEICDESVLWFGEPEEDQIFSLNARIRNKDGNIVFEISNNEWTVRPSGWDVTTINNKIVVYTDDGTPSISLIIHPPDVVEIEHINTFVSGQKLLIDKYGVVLADTGLAQMKISGGIIIGSRAGISLKPDGQIEFGSN